MRQLEMYPRISDLLIDWFGIELPIPLNSFGLMLAASVLVAGWLGEREVRRYFSAGKLTPIREGDDANPGQLMGAVVTIAIVFGLAGARLFHILENWGQFRDDPMAMIISPGGFTFYGGFLLASIVGIWYLRRHRQDTSVWLDATAPGIMLAYGIGRIGCHLAGDGDWGTAANLAAKPSWVPMWLWAEDYPRNLMGIDLSQAPVYPTPLYEFAMAAILFGVLWSIRVHRHRAGWLFGVYLVLAGLERSVIEVFRVNNVGTFAGIPMTQAQFISVLLVLAGIVLVMRRRLPLLRRAA